MIWTAVVSTWPPLAARFRREWPNWRLRAHRRHRAPGCKPKTPVSAAFATKTPFFLGIRVNSGASLVSSTVPPNDPSAAAERPEPESARNPGAGDLRRGDAGGH